MKKAFLFLALCLLGAGRAAAAEPVDSVRNVIYMIGDGMGLAHVSMLAVEGGYAPTAFDRAQGIALISTYSANPAAFYAHVPDRGNEKAITRDLLASNIDVLIGAGRRLEKESPEGGSYRDAFGRRGYAVVGSLEEAEPVRAGRLLCAVTDENIPKTIRREDYLRCATQKALEILVHNADSVGRGFVLMVEGSLIDGASHGNDAEKILAEMRDFERAVAAAMDFADRTPGTLVVVTADHETGGLAIPSCDGDFTRSESGIRYVFGSKSHTATYVPVYLYGTGAGHIAGIMDNTQLARRVMALLGKE